MLNSLLYKLSGYRPVRLIALDGRPYLERYYLGQVFGVTFYLHRFVSGDCERHIHNHPWRWGASLILTGGYVEQRATDIRPTAGPSGCVVKNIKRRWFNRVDGNTFHRVHHAEPGTWTLFAHGPRIEGKGWGFLTQQADWARPIQTTVFMPYLSGPGGWWHDAPRGWASEREPLL